MRQSIVRVQGSRDLLSSVLFVSFLLSGCRNDGFFCCGSHLATWGPSLTVVLVLEAPSAWENQIFFVRPIPSWTNAVGGANFVDQNTYNEPFLLRNSRCCQPGTPWPLTIGLSQIMEPSALTRPYCHLFGVGISRSNAIKYRVRIIQIQQRIVTP